MQKADFKLIEKEGVAVYYPEDPLERAIQDASHAHVGEWLSSYQCQLVASAISSLKIFDTDWITNEELFRQRMDYLFDLAMTNNKDILVFVTHKLYLRDILENREINAYLHSPVVFVTKPIAHFLLREYPIHIHVIRERILAKNDADLFTIGGMLLSDGEDVSIDECILEVKTVSNADLEFPVKQEEAEDIGLMTGVKAAASQIAPGVFQIDEHERVLRPDQEIWDKELREDGVILAVEPGETGKITIRYTDGHDTSIGKMFFDHRFVVV